MTAIPEHRMTVDEFLAWAKDKPGRYELHGGKIYAMSPERAGHATTKFAIQTILKQSIDKARLPCHMLPDGMTVRVDKDAAHEPDALVYCGPRVADDVVEIGNPVIVVEVLSPSTRYVDASAKLAGYFKLPSVQHYLIVDPGKPPLIHHQRQSDDTILTRLIHTGPITLAPPGLTIDVSEIFSDGQKD